MKLKEQKELLATIGEAHAIARKLYDGGVKISGVVQRLRAAGEELESRIRFIEKQPKAKKKESAPPPPPFEPNKEESPAGQRP